MRSRKPLFVRIFIKKFISELCSMCLCSLTIENLFRVGNSIGGNCKFEKDPLQKNQNEYLQIYICGRIGKND